MPLTKKIVGFVAVMIGLMMAPNALPAEKVHSLEIGSEISHFAFSQHAQLVKDSGTFYGAYGTYTFKPEDDNWITRLIDVYQIDAHYGVGSLVYKGAGTKYDDTDYQIEPRFLAGKEFSPGWMTVTPYSGFGYRYFFRDGIVETGFIDDTYHYLYLPLGVYLDKEFEGGWKIHANVEYDQLIRGYYSAPFSDLNDSVNTYTDLENTHKKGYGLRTSIQIEKNVGCVNIVLAPYLRYWNIGSSDITYYYSNGTPNAHQETKVIIAEIGLSFGVKF